MKLFIDIFQNYNDQSYRFFNLSTNLASIFITFVIFAKEAREKLIEKIDIKVESERTHDA